LSPATPLSPLSGGRSRPSAARRLLRDTAWVLIITGVLLLADATVTLLWQEPLTAVIAMIKRGEIDKRFLSYRTSPLTPPDERVLAALQSVQQRTAFLAEREQREVGAGAAVGRIVIPRIGLDAIIVQGTDTSSLEKGPGHYSSTALPGLGQTVAIAGHRTTYLAPFRHIDALRPGDRISVQMPYGRFIYTVQYHRIVTPYAWWITRNVGYERLVLSACNPLFSAAQRIVVFARLSSLRPSAFTSGGRNSSIRSIVPMRIGKLVVNR
jgi:sortase A